MERAQRRGRNGQGDGHGETGDLSPDHLVEGLRQRFARFRREHRPRTRYPQALRSAVLAALRRGATELEVRRVCGVTSVQLAQWRRSEGVPAEESSLFGQEARVFSVVDELVDVNAPRAVRPGEGDVELRLGGWTIWIRRFES
jgi:hypothetical protein